jgi:ribulose-5-phosphate 4-epimerase/fuculose-1-phosphate aldolase
MQKLIDKYIGKLESQRLVEKDEAVLIAVDADMFSSRPLNGDLSALKEVLGLMSVSSILFARPAEPYWSMVCEILSCECGPGGACGIVPMDCETRTFFHDIPVINEFSPGSIVHALSHRKSAIIRNRGILTFGTVTPEQSYVSFSSTCFSVFVKYFCDSLRRFETYAAEGQPIPEAELSAFKRIVRESLAGPAHAEPVILSPGPPGNEDEAVEMLAETGRAVVSRGLVDSCFGNISYVLDDKMLISQTGSSLDELEGCIDITPLDGSSSAGITASSELSAHRNIFLQTGERAILHGHPKYSVIMSMRCNKSGCSRTDCHRACPEKRDILGTPIVPGEIGTGAFGLVNTVPAAMKSGRGVIVYGHGVFTAGPDDFRGPFDMLSGIEQKCRDAYFSSVNELLEHLGQGD